ncbi:MAG: hypothetical protein FJ125_07345 [Deltaproteobacteria bacterium]|nr:hypothetical protein [Deltaproteobacteria bacterium]
MEGEGRSRRSPGRASPPSLSIALSPHLTLDSRSAKNLEKTTSCVLSKWHWALPEKLQGTLRQVVAICQAHQVRRLELFGSAARGTFDPATSDMDLLVEFVDLPPAERARRYFDLLEALEQLLGRSVDLVEPAAVRNPFVRKEIDATRVVLYEAA